MINSSFRRNIAKRYEFNEEKLYSMNETSPQKFSANDGKFLPVDAFMEKPIKPKEFVAKVKELLALKKDQINVEGRKA
mgnify:CR=1 FL=1